MCVIARLMTNDGDNDDVVDDDDGDADDDGYGREIEEYDDDYGATDDAGDLTVCFSFFCVSRSGEATHCK